MENYEEKIKQLKELLDKRIAEGKSANTELAISKQDDKEVLIIRKHYAFETKKQDDGTFTHPVSDGKKDRDWDMIDVNGWELKDFKKNPVVMFGHDYRTMPIGKNKGIKAQDGFLMAKTEFDPNDEFAQKVQQKYETGFMKAWSVGFIPLEWETYHDEKSGRSGVHYKKTELLEYSAVPIPANPRAIASVGKSIEEEIEGKAKVDFTDIEEIQTKDSGKIEISKIEAMADAIIEKAKAIPSDNPEKSIYDLILGDPGLEPKDDDKNKNLSEDDIESLAKAIAIKLKLILLNK